MQKFNWSLLAIRTRQTHLLKYNLLSYKILIQHFIPKITKTSFGAPLAWTLLRKVAITSIGWSSLGTELGNHTSKDTHLPLAIVDAGSSAIFSDIKLNPATALWSLFRANWRLIRSKGSTTVTPHGDFKLLFLGSSRDSVSQPIVGVRQYFSRWVDSYNLMFNLLYVTPRVQLFSNKLFIEETLVFNWYYSKKNYKLFRYTQPFYMFKDLDHGETTHSLMFFTAVKQLDCGIIVDLKTHLKGLGYLTKQSIYTIGLIPISSKPWQVSYPIPAYSNSRLMQFYFLRLLFVIKSSANFNRYENLISSSQQNFLMGNKKV